MRSVMELTKEQQQFLAPMFDELAKRNSDALEIRSCVVAQVYRDSMIVVLLSGKKAFDLQRAMGGSGASRSAQESIGEQA